MAAGETIAAIATAPGKAGIAVVRVSGPEAFSIARQLAGRKADIPATSLSARVVALPGLDPTVVLLAFRAPHSYTGEDVVEVQCHGGTVTPHRILEATFAAGARLARRGEFTERAFLNGRLGYEQAQGVLDLINARTDRAADAALEELAGRSDRTRRELYEQALGLSSDYEHALDIDESDLGEEFFSALRARAAALAADLRVEIDRLRRAQRLRDGWTVVIAGPPNAGKSSLLNALLQENRAIVSDVPGTTRDSIEAWLDLEGLPVRLVDTAGLREAAADAIEREGVERSKRLIASADLVLRLGDEVQTADELVVHAKCDLGRREGPLNVSTRTGEGLEELKEAIVRRLSRLDVAEDASGLDQLLAAAQWLESREAQSDDLVIAANAVRQAATALGRIIGAEYSADLLDRLFSKFCVGK